MNEDLVGLRRDIEISIETMVLRCLANVFRELADRMEPDGPHVLPTIYDHGDDMDFTPPSKSEPQKAVASVVVEKKKAALTQTQQKCQKCGKLKPHRWMKAGTCTKCLETPELPPAKEPAVEESKSTQQVVNEVAGLNYLHLRLVKMYGEDEFNVGDAMCLTDLEYEATLTMLKRLARQGLARRIGGDEKHHLALWQVIPA